MRGMGGGMLFALHEGKGRNAFRFDFPLREGEGEECFSRFEGDGGRNAFRASRGEGG